MGEPNDYGAVASLYDAYVGADFDLEFFRERVARAPGRVLELMAGTGRVTGALQGATRGLTCVDRSAPMLRVLRGKLGARLGSVVVICADVRALPCKADAYTLALIPFNSFAELTGSEDRRRTLREIHRVLRAGGQLICTLHNPVVRRGSLDGRRRQLGDCDLGDGRRLEILVEASVDAASGLARSLQTFRLYDASGELEEERLQVVRFVLLTATEMEAEAGAAGFRVVERLGDYDGSPYEETVSPYMICTLEKVTGVE